LFIQVFLRYVNRHLPRDEVKVLIGDSLAAHLSPVVTDLCELHNIRLLTKKFCKIFFY
jgi:hypothetical protein